MRITWFPWRFIVRRVARAHGFLDPITVLSRLHRFAQPAEVAAPTELLRMGAVLHARGLMNSQAIQHNLDWVWPFWVVRQYDPHDVAFVPRAFSLTHINLTHRNWTAIGLPDLPEFPLVDPRGLLTPFFDSWSLDAWLLTEDGGRLLPSTLPTVAQRMELNATLAVHTDASADGLRLHARAEVVQRLGWPLCRLALRAQADRPGWLVVAIRPFNPEGVSFVHHISRARHGRGWLVEGRQPVSFNAVPDRMAFSRYRLGDVFQQLPQGSEAHEVRSDAGMATAAALFTLTPDCPREVTVTTPATSVPLLRVARARRGPGTTWRDALSGACRVRLPDARLQTLFDEAVRTLILHSPGTEVFPGPFTYKHFWFRDAAFIVHALLCAGLERRAARVLAHYPARQNAFGYFRSQDGEWDANGEALWIMRRFCELTGRPPLPGWRRAIRRGADWILRKRLPRSPDSPHAGLFPAGFSAEHLGPNDYYYWDDFWGVAGLQAAAVLLDALGDPAEALRYRGHADEFLAAVERSLARAAVRLDSPAMPASPYRRMDAGAIGSLVAGYPLQLFVPEDARLARTARYLLEQECLDGAFFQEISHSGLNAYLTLHLAQTLLRAGNTGYAALMDAVADLASPTGQWPEAIHPQTRGGCMGDGQHVWAAAEWVLMIRNCFLREEGRTLILGSGLRAAWLDTPGELAFGPAPTTFGPVTVTLRRSAEELRIAWETAWRGEPPSIEIRLPGRAPLVASPHETSLRVPLPRS